jgi:hypothetical protein
MMPSIGFMIGCYILVRMLIIMTRPKGRREHWSVLILALVTSIVTVVVMVSLVAGPPPPALC